MAAGEFSLYIIITDLLRYRLVALCTGPDHSLDVKTANVDGVLPFFFFYAREK